MIIGRLDLELIHLREWMDEIGYPDLIWPSALDYLKNMKSTDFDKIPADPLNRKKFDSYTAAVIAAELGEETSMQTGDPE